MECNMLIGLNENVAQIFATYHHKMKTIMKSQPKLNNTKKERKKEKKKTIKIERGKIQRRRTYGWPEG